MANLAPYQLWMDLVPISSAIGVSGTVTVTTTAAHGITKGAYVQVAGLTGAGTAFNAVAQVATASGTTFTYVTGSSSGTATVTAGVVSYDLLNPLTNYASGADQLTALFVELSSLQLSANGDGSGSSMSVKISQQVTPSAGPWYSTAIPDNTRFRFIIKETGVAPATDKTDVIFLGVLTSFQAEINEAGQGTETTLSLGDVNYILDKTSIFGKISSPKAFAPSKISRSSGTATIDFGRILHGFVVGQPILVSGVAGGGLATPFTGTYRVSAATPTTLSYPNAGSNVSVNPLSRFEVSVSRSGQSNDRITIAARYPDLGLRSGDTITLNPGGSYTGFSNAAQFVAIIRGTYSGDRVVSNSANSVTLTLSKPYVGTWGTIGGYSNITTVPSVADASRNGQLLVQIPGGITEDAAVESLLSLVNNFHSTDYPLQRLLDTTDTSQIIGSTSIVNEEAIQFDATSLRSGLDTIVEQFSGSDVKARRYHIDPQGRLNFKLVDAASQPALPDAPYLLTTSSYGTPNKTDGPSSIAPYGLNVTWDHETTKNALFSIPSSTGSPVSLVTAYDEILDGDGTAVYTTREGAPRFDGVVDFPTAVKNPGATLKRAATAFYIERHRPLLSGSFRLLGASTSQPLGFLQGYGAQTIGSIVTASRAGSTVTITTGSSHNSTAGQAIIISGLTGTNLTTMNGTFTVGSVTSGSVFTYTAVGSAGVAVSTAASGYVYRPVYWKPGQFVSIDAPALGVSSSTLYRVEQVSLTLQEGSYSQSLDVTFSRKNPSDLANLIASYTK